ncbi:MAG: glycosyltransferase [Candidatus Rokubacteria bacterium]|nr:glycosyltransferase [Candidatus Rokubacteria bacterium]
MLPFDRPEHMGVDLATELGALGHEVRTFAYRRENPLYKNKSTKAAYQRVIARRLVARARAWRPHVVIVVKGGPVTPDVIRAIRERTGARFVNVFPDNPLWMLDFAHIEPYDVFFTKERFAIRQLQLVGLRNLHYLAPWCVPAYHHPVTPTDDERAALAGRAAIVGSWYPYRERFLAEIADYPIRIFGAGWKRAVNPRVRALVAGGSVFGRAKLAVYSAATVSINLHHPMNDVAGVNTRLFELAAAGACQLVDAKDDVTALFKAGEEVLTFRDLGEVRRQLDYYLAHPDEARAIGANAHRRALAEHTVRHRVDEIVAVLRERFGEFA